MIEVLCRRRAMATLFEFLLRGDEEEHLRAVGEAALDEVERIERLISMFDPTSELARVNREAFGRPVVVSRELFDILDECRLHHELTLGWFDPCHGYALPFVQGVQLDKSSCRVRFTHPETRIDLGGYGKGVALDAAYQTMIEFKQLDVLLHGGTSSISVAGEWRIDLRSPTGDRAIDSVMLDCESLSSSAHGTIGTVAIAKLARVAEAWSTAMLMAGVDRLDNFIYDQLYSAAWIDTEVHWLEGWGLWKRTLAAHS